MLTLHQSNRPERLVDRLAEQLAGLRGDPFHAETLIVPSRGMARWLCLALADRLGIATQLRFVLPGAFLWNLAGQLGDSGAALGPLEREPLSWRLFAGLPDWIERPEFGLLRRYLTHRDDELSRFRLARQLADRFDEYQIYRGDRILAWERGEPDEDWQAALWRAIRETAGVAPHRAGLIGALSQPQTPLPGLPPRLYVFGLSSLPPAYLAVLDRCAADADVHLFFANPCAEFWGDIADRATLAKWQAQRPSRALHQETGHPLLAALGRQGREFLQLLYDGQAVREEIDDFVEPGRASLLQALQSDILHLTAQPEPLPPDESIRVHVCHGPLREVQVLHDRLLALFDADPTLTPADVVVMVPTIETYAPYAESVFAVREAPGRSGVRLPAAIADRSVQMEEPLLDAFLALLGLPDDRLGAADVFGWLQVGAIRRRFGIADDELATLRRWIEEAGIRWGLDGEAKTAWKLPAEPANTWRFGLDRLLAGYALAPTVDFYAGIAPYPDLEAQDAILLGRLAALVDRLAEFRGRLVAPRTIADWIAALDAVRDAFFDPDDEDETALQSLLEAIDTLRVDTELAGFTAPVGRAVVVDALRGRFAAMPHPAGFLTGRITFCSLVPMRSIPFRVVCLLGLNDADFPRRRTTPAFDLMTRSPRPGDRSRREDDRYLFLEALLSARDRLHLSYVGRNPRDNAEKLPAIPLRELIDAVAELLGLPHRAADGSDRTRQLAAAGLIVEHPLQAFNPRYYDGSDPALFSYAAEWAVDRSGWATEPFITGPLTEPPDPALLEISTDLLRRFFAAPARYFLEQRLQIFEAREALPLMQTEPFELDGLSRFKIVDAAVRTLLDEADEESADRQRCRALGLLPQGAFGDRAHRTLWRRAEALAEQVAAHWSPPRPAIGTIELTGPDWRFISQPLLIGENGLVRYRVGKLRAIDRLDLWLSHLLIQQQEVPEPAKTSRFIAEDRIFTLRPLPAEVAREHLLTLLALYRSGLDQPLPFFPTAALAFVAEMQKGVAPGEALDKAAYAFIGDAYSGARAEGDDAANRLAFRGRDPFTGELGSQFAVIADAVFGPMLAAAS